MYQSVRTSRSETAFGQLREELRREAQRLSCVEEEGKLALDKGRRELQRSQVAVTEEGKQVEVLRLETERALAETRSAREGVEREREDMFKGFQEVKVALEVGADEGLSGALGLTLRGRG